MKTNSPANSAPAARPAPSVPSRSKSGMPRRRAQAKSSTVARIERIAACITNGTSPTIHLIVTCWNPHSAVSATLRANAFESSALRSCAMGRDFGVGFRHAEEGEEHRFEKARCRARAEGRGARRRCRTRTGARDRAARRLLLGSAQGRSPRAVRHAGGGGSGPARGRRRCRGGPRGARGPAGSRIRARYQRVDRPGYRRAGGGSRPPHRRPLIARTPLLACCAGIVAWSAATAQPAVAPEYDCLIEARQALDIRSPVEGVIETVHVQRGASVRKGQTLALLFSGPERAALDLARSRAGNEGEIKSAEARVDITRKKWERAEELVKKNFVSANARDEVLL